MMFGTSFPLKTSISSFAAASSPYPKIKWSIGKFLNINSAMNPAPPMTILLLGKSNFKDDTIIVHNHINKNILQTTINNKDTSNDEIRWCSIDLFIDNLYSFENNPNLIFYKLKVISIDYLD